MITLRFFKYVILKCILLFLKWRVKRVNRSSIFRLKVYQHINLLVVLGNNKKGVHGLSLVDNNQHLIKWHEKFI
jgi:hypothetical protein